MGRRIAALALVLGLVLAGAGEASAARSGRYLKVINSAYGRVIVDGHSYALYGFTRDPRYGKSRCYGGCAVAWPPLIVGAKPKAAAGARAGQIGTTRRRDGRLQATYGGYPLYYYVGERRPFQIFCQNVFQYGGLWLVVGPSGRLVR